MLEQQTKQLRIRLYARLSKDDGEADKGWEWQGWPNIIKLFFNDSQSSAFNCFRRR